MDVPYHDPMTDAARKATRLENSLRLEPNSPARVQQICTMPLAID